MATVEAARPQDGLKEVHGRIMNTVNEVYVLPADEEEMDRLTLQHRILLSLLNGLLPVDEEAIKKLMTLKDGHQPAIIDVGSGSGTWTSEIAAKFPHARVVGFDLAPGRPPKVPPNCSFIKGDAHRDLAQFNGQFDLVHCRCMEQGTSDIQHVFNEMTNCLRPGGLLILAGGELPTVDEQRQSITDPNKSRFARLLIEVNAVRAKGGAKHNSREWFGLLDRSPQFRDAKYKAYYCPINWEGVPEDNLVDGAMLGRLMQENCLVFVQAVKPLLLAGGHSPEVVDEWLRTADDELHDPNVHNYTRWHYSWAYKQNP